MTLSEMATALLEQADESGSGFMTTADAKALVNRALRDLSIATNFRLTSYTLAVTSVEMFDLTSTASGFLALFGVYDGTGWLTPTTLPEVRQMTLNWHSARATPTHYFTRGPWNLVLFPRLPSGSTNMTILVSEIQPDLTDAQSPDLPAEMHEQIVDGALMLHYIDEKEIGKYDLMNARWKATVQKTREWQSSKLSNVRTLVVGGTCPHPL